MTSHEIMRRQRERLGLTQAEVAAKAGLSEKGYWLIENGRSKGRYKTMFAIAQVLNLPPETIAYQSELSSRQRRYWPTEAAYALVSRTPHPFPPNLAAFMESINR